MLTKLAFKNAGKSARDYAVYFFTLVLGVSVFYMFNSIYAQQEIMVVTETLNKSMLALREILSVVSVFVAVVLGFLIVYANSFFIKRRKKELGIYMILGMDKHSISWILIMETTVMAIVALFLGLAIGVLGSQFMSVITANLFEADMSGFQFVFSVEATLKSILYFAVIFSVVILFNMIAINRYKLIDLIYGGRKNESCKTRNMGVSLSIFAVSLLCLGTAYYLILENGMVDINAKFFWSIGLGTVGTLLFFFSVSGMLLKIMQSNKKIYYKNLNMFVTRQLSSKINTNFVSVSVVCIVLLQVIGIFSCGYSLQNAFSTELRRNVPYDFSLYGVFDEGETLYDSLPEEVKAQNITWNEYVRYNSGQKLHFSDFPVDYSSVPFNIAKHRLAFILQRDYNAITKMQGQEPIALAEDEYLIVSGGEYYEEVCNQFLNQSLTIPLFENIELKLVDTIEKIMLDNSGGGMYFVVSDCYESQLTEISEHAGSVLNINCSDAEVTKIIQESLNAQMENRAESNIAYYDFTGKQQMYELAITTKVVIAFLAIYLGIVFMISCAAILAIQQLSEAADNKSRYDLLHKLGAEKKMINRALFVQILCYFVFPLLLAVVHAAVGLTAANQVIQDFGNLNIAKNIFVTACFIIGVYGAYFGLTYMSSKNIIGKE